MTTATIILMEVDAHAYPLHVREDWMGDDYAEVGPDNLVRIAETFGILIRFVDDHPDAGWAWWYEIQGPRENLARFLAAEGFADEETAKEMVWEPGWDGVRS